LRENYRQKGPAGFLEGYKIVFPEVFTPAEEGPVYVDQTKAGAVEPKTDIYTFVEEDAQFPGGDDALKKYLAENVHYPEIAYELGIVGKHVVQFVITKDGSVSQVKMKKKLPDCRECDDEVIRVVKRMPKWVPAEVNGKAVDSYYVLPFSIHLE
jgi:periplasmic protein TonB